MKISYRITLKTVCSLLFFYTLIACQPEEELVPKSNTGTVVFSTALSENSTNNRLEKLFNDDLSQVILTIETDSSVISRELDLFNFEGSWITEPIALQTADYKVTQFLISNNNNDIVYAAPTTESKYADLVEKPLPLNFSVQTDETTKVTVEVISTLESTPEDFGYTTFAFEVAQTFDFLLSVFHYDSTSENFELTSSYLTVLVDNDTLVHYDLEAITQSIKVLDGYDQYELLVEKENYLTYRKVFSNKTLKSYNSLENGPIIVKLESSVNLAQGLRAHYPFTGDANDATSYMYHGTVTGAMLTNDKFNSSENAYIFDGQDDRIDVGSVDLGISSQISVSAWVKTSSLKDNHWVIGKYNWVEDKGISLRIIDGNAHFSGRDGNDEFITANGNSTINDGKWHHLVGIVNDSIWQIWVDGNLEAEVNTNHNSVNISSDDPLSIGYYYQGTGEGLQRYFGGTIDNVRIYNRPINSTEIQQLFQNYQ